MSPLAIGLAQTRFQAALTPGASVAPVALSQLLVQFNMESDSQAFDAEPIGHNIADEFPFLRYMLASGISPDAASSEAWEAAVRWLLSALRNWETTEENSFNKLRALLSAVTALDVKLSGLSSISAQIASGRLNAGLGRLIESTDVEPGFSERRFPEFRQQLGSFAKSGNFERLWQMLPHTNVFPAPDFWAAVTLMYNADPTELATIIERRNDILFSLMICTVLETQAIVLANRVDNLVFKFVSVANFWQDRSVAPAENSQSILQGLLLQVAETSVANWAAWMQALFKVPGNNSTLDKALASVLQLLSKEHWVAFFNALSLDYSHRAAAPVANILVPLANSSNFEGKMVMCSSAYQVWSEWNYGKHESSHAMFAPAACALDFPVSMYFSSLANDERFAEERTLLEAIDTVEQQSFNSLTELVTERNRLKSCLRLVQHGTALANGSDQALPASIEPDADAYANTRYHYYEVNTS